MLQRVSGALQCVSGALQQGGLAGILIDYLVGLVLPNFGRFRLKTVRVCFVCVYAFIVPFVFLFDVRVG
jgi:hypothetical protein